MHFGQCYFQVTLHSQVKATLTIYDSWLDLQDGFVHAGRGDGRPTSAFFPLVIAPTAKAGILFCICLGTTIPGGKAPFSATNNHIFQMLKWNLKISTYSCHLDIQHADF